MTSVLWKPKSNEMIKEITSQSGRIYLVMEPGRDTTPKEGSGNMKLLDKVAEKFADMHFNKSKFLSRNTPEEWVNTIEDVFSEDVIMEETKKGKEKRFCFTPQTSIIIPNSVYWQKLQPKSEVQFRPTVTLRLKRKKGEKSIQMKKAPRKNKTQKKAPAKGKKAPAKGKVSEDGSGFIPAASTSSTKGKTKMTPKAIAAKKYMGEMFDSSDPEASDDGWDDVMETLHDRKWNPKTKDYEKMPEMSLGSLGKSSSSSSLELLSESDSDSSKLDYGSDASTDFDDEPTTGWARQDKFERRREKEDAWNQENHTKEALDDDLRKKVKSKEMDVYDAYDVQNKRWQKQQDDEEEETDRYFTEMYGDEDQSSSEGYDSEEDRKRRIEALNLDYAIANGWSKQRDKEGTVFYTHSKSGANVKGNKDGLLEPHLAQAAYEKAMKQKNTMSSSTMSLPNVNTGAPKPWIERESRSKKPGMKFWYNPVTKISFWPKTQGKWTQKEADDAAERAKKKGGKKSRKKKKKTRRKKGGKRKKTKKRKLRKKRKTRR